MFRFIEAEAWQIGVYSPGGRWYSSNELQIQMTESNDKYQTPNAKHQVPNTKYQMPNTKYQMRDDKYKNHPGHVLPHHDAFDNHQIDILDPQTRTLEGLWVGNRWLKESSLSSPL